MSEYETQKRIMHQSNVVRDCLSSLYEWEKDIKSCSSSTQQNDCSISEVIDQSNPIRSQKQTPATATSSNMCKSNSLPNMKKSPPNVEKANEFKTRGNDCVKAGHYQKAVHYYTEAIRLNKSEAVYYTNRALCYLKQQKYAECIGDCSAAIAMDDKSVKAYYRRMQAHEQMEDGDLVAALHDCEHVLKIEPKNAEARRGLDRIKQLVKGAKTNSTPAAQANDVQKGLGESFLLRETSSSATVKMAKKEAEQAPWSKYDGSTEYERIDFISKAPHLRSKQTLKRISIGDKKQLVNVDTAGLPQIESSSSDTTNVKSDKADGETHTICEHLPSAKSTTDFAIPKTTAQLYKTWSSTKDTNAKFEILKGIYDIDVSKLLGAQFDINILREIFSILRQYFVVQSLPIIKIMKGVVNNPEMKIIAVLMTATDKLVFAQLVEYMRANKEDFRQIEAIETTFSDLIME